ncbi:unnamed protein product [Gordionus sp. m RMFG-2023]
MKIPTVSENLKAINLGSSFQQNVIVDAQAWFTDTENTNLIVPSTNTSCAGESTINIANALIDLHHSHSPRFINSQKGKPLLFYNMFLYRIDHHKDLISYYRCRNISCKGRCKYDGIYTMTCGHSHQHETYIYEKLRTKEVIEILVAENPLESRLTIYNKAMQIRCSECLDIAEYPEAIPSFVSFKTTIDRILKKYRPVLPYAVEEIILTPEFTLTMLGEQFLIYTQYDQLETLPLIHKYVLLASFLASSNSTNTDDFYFSKEKNRKRITTRKKNQSSNCHLRIPKNFSLHRLMSIFRSITEGWVNTNFCFSIDFQISVATLVSKTFLIPSKNIGVVEGQKYRCSLSLDLVKLIAKDLEFDISAFIQD